MGKKVRPMGSSKQALKHIFAISKQIKTKKMFASLRDNVLNQEQRIGRKIQITFFKRKSISFRFNVLAMGVFK